MLLAICGYCWLLLAGVGYTLATLLPYDTHIMQRGKLSAVLGNACFPCSGLECRMSFGPAVARLPKESSCMSLPRNLQVMPAAKHCEPLRKVRGPRSAQFTSHTPIRVTLCCSSHVDSILWHCRLLMNPPLLGALVAFMQCRYAWPLM